MHDLTMHQSGLNKRINAPDAIITLLYRFYKLTEKAGFSRYIKAKYVLEHTSHREILSDSQVLRHTDLSASANFSHRTASFTYVQLSAYHTHTVCIFCPHFLTALLKGQCKFPITLGLTVFT